MRLLAASERGPLVDQVIEDPLRLDEDDAPASHEFRAVLVKELGHRTRGAAGDLLEGVGRVVVLTGEDRPLACDQQLSRPRRYPGVDEPVEEGPLGSGLEGDGLTEFC